MMAKISKTQLKSVVKECLLELLSEGLDHNVAQLNTRRKAKKKQKVEEQRLAEQRKRFEYTVDNTVTAVTDDPIMQSIFQDTARTTLQEQTSNEPRGHSQGSIPVNTAGSSAAAGIDLDGIFDSSDKNWEKLAFDE
jgi:hypothetical protein